MYNYEKTLSLFLFIFILALALITFNVKAQQVTDNSDRPNIIFIMTDDHAFQAISAYGSTLINTPGIDRLAKEGMRFDKAFVTNSLCSPSRAVALTGKFSHLNGVTDNEDVFDSAQVTFPKMMRQHGYHTAVIGKWHLKSIPSGFDYWKILPDQGDYYQPEFITSEGTIVEKGYVTEVTTELAIAHLQSIEKNNQPFMLMIHHKAPHREWWPALEDIKSIKDKVIPEPASLFDDYKNRSKASYDAEMRIADHMSLTMDNKLHPSIVEDLHLKEFMPWYADIYTRTYDRLTTEEKKQWDEIYKPINKAFKENPPAGATLTKWKYQRYMQDYLACIKSVDDQITRLLNYLDASGLSENTLVIYTSDQGFYLGEHGWFDKRFMYEPSFRTPLIMRWPGIIAPGTVNTDLVQNLDFAPTILSAAGIKPPADMQGKSLLPLMRMEKTKWREDFILSLLRISRNSHGQKTLWDPH